MLLLLDNYDSFTWNLVHRFAEIDPALVPGRELRVVRNDEASVERIEALNAGAAPRAIVISPGPCTPNEAGISNEVIRRFAGRVPILGVCLGHQCLASAFGLLVVRHHARHGKTSQIHHDGSGVFAGLPNPFEAMRYHSLVVPWDWERDAPGGSTEPKGGSPRPGVPTMPGVSSAPSRGLPPLGSDGSSTLVGRWRASAWAFDDLPDGTRARVVMGLRFEHELSSKHRAPLEGVQFHPESFVTGAGLELLRNFVRDAGLRHHDARAS